MEYTTLRGTNLYVARNKKRKPLFGVSGFPFDLTTNLCKEDLMHESNIAILLYAVKGQLYHSCEMSQFGGIPLKK